MSSNYEFDSIECKKICRVCLSSGDNVYAMTNSEIFAYREVVPTSSYKVVCNYSEMFICIYCRYLLRKIKKFIQQCLKAEDLLSNCYEQNLKLYTHKLYNFTTKTTIHKFPDDDVDSDHDYDDDIPLVMYKNDDEPLRIEKTESTTEPVKAESSEIQNGVENVKKRTKTKKLKQKRQKVAKEGFSSRMVQETDEYTVIKLTKEQVLKEMEDRSKSEDYQRSLFKCEKCVKGFNFEDVLLTHMEKHTAETGSLKCDICSQYCPSAVSLRGHMKSHTTRYSCKICGIQRRSRQHLLEHYSISHTECSAVYRCKTCPFTTNKRTVMQRHSRSHARSARLPCERCGELFKSRDTLRVHTLRHEWGSLQCSQCPETFVYPALLRRHERSAHGQTDYYCVECDLRFKTADNLRIHFKRAKRHRDASSYTHSCPQCPQKFMTVSSLAGHMSSAHGVPKQHSCDICGRSYSTRSAARAHSRSAHAHEASRACGKNLHRKILPCTTLATLRAHTDKHAQKENGLLTEIGEGIPNEG